MPSKPKLMTMATKVLSLSALKQFTKEDLYGVYQPTEVTFQGEAVAVLLPYEQWLHLSELILDADATIDRLSSELGEAVFGSDNKW